MGVYFGAYAIILFAGIYSYFLKDEQKKKRIICFTGFLVVFLVLALRHQRMGIDLKYREAYGYLWSFDIIGRASWDLVLRSHSFLNYERGYMTFNKLVSVFTTDRNVFMAICAFLSVTPVFIYIYKKSKRPLMSIIIYLGLPVFLICFSGLRQGIAIGLTVLSMFLIEKKKPILFVLLTIFTASFHSSAYIFLLAYPLYHFKINSFWKIISVAIVPVVYLLRVPLFIILSKLFQDDAEIENTGAFLLFAVFYIIYIFLIYYNKDRHENDGHINLFYFGVLCQVFGGVYNIAMRVGYYFMIYATIAIPNVTLSMNDKKSAKISEWIILVAFLAFGLYSLFSKTSWAQTNPYYFFWQP